MYSICRLCLKDQGPDFVCLFDHPNQYTEQITEMFEIKVKNSSAHLTYHNCPHSPFSHISSSSIPRDGLKVLVPNAFTY